MLPTPEMIAAAATACAAAGLFVAAVRDFAQAPTTFDRLKATLVVEFHLRPHLVTPQTYLADFRFGAAETVRLRDALMQTFPGFNLFSYAATELRTVADLVARVDEWAA